MSGIEEHDITGLLERWQGGDDRAAEALFSATYQTLRRIAVDSMRGQSPDHTLQPTAVVHEAYCRLVAQREWGWKNRRHFYRIAARMMRRVLVDHARKSGRIKRGGHMVRVPLREVRDTKDILGDPVEVLALDRALAKLSADDARQAVVVELRFFAGLRLREVAEVLGCSVPTVTRSWRAARARLYKALREERRDGSKKLEEGTTDLPRREGGLGPNRPTPRQPLLG